MKSHVLLLGLVFLASGAVAQNTSTQTRTDDPSVLGGLMSSQPRYSRELVLGNILKGALENMHFTGKAIDNNLSKNAFKVYLERLDYGKQFLLESDVKALEKYREQFDDMMVDGNLTILDTSF